MDDRTMPFATFRCKESPDQSSVRLTRHFRREGKPDQVDPTPLCPSPSCISFNKPMSLMQIDYGQGIS